ncbi:MAG: hypothetical protein JWQ09_361 [Segetibacter sp.]|nr:hypothetical protein [Segetibacter sp.]
MKDKITGWVGARLMASPIVKHELNAGYKLNMYKLKRKSVLPFTFHL